MTTPLLPTLVLYLTPTSRIGYCYYDNAAVLYAAVPVSYGVLNSDVANIASLGNTLCAEAEACYAPIRDAVRVRVYF